MQIRAKYMFTLARTGTTQMSSEKCEQRKWLSVHFCAISQQSSHFVSPPTPSSSSDAGGEYSGGRGAPGHRRGRASPVPVLVASPVHHVGTREHYEVARRRVRRGRHVAHIAHEYQVVLT